MKYDKFLIENTILINQNAALTDNMQQYHKDPATSIAHSLLQKLYINNANVMTLAWRIIVKTKFS